MDMTVIYDKMSVLVFKSNLLMACFGSPFNWTFNGTTASHCS